MLVITRTRGTPEATYGPLMGAITQACAGVGVDVRLGTLVVDESDRPMEVPRLVGQAGIDGFLVIGPWLSSAAASLLGDRPIVLVDGDAEDRDTHSSVVSDDAGGAADATSRADRSRASADRPRRRDDGYRWCHSGAATRIRRGDGRGRPRATLRRSTDAGPADRCRRRRTGAAPWTPLQCGGRGQRRDRHRHPRRARRRAACRFLQPSP